MYKSTEEKLKGVSADIYRRKSQEDKSRQILSLETQSDICDDLVEYWKVTIGENYEESKSAKTAKERPLFEQMMHRIEKGKTEVIVCWKIDRLVRNMREGGWIIDLLQSGKLKAIITKDKVYLPEDNTIITAIEMASATEYSQELSRKVNDGNAKKARKGIPNGIAVLGYVNNKHKDQGKRDWRDDPKRWKLLQQGLRKILDENISPSKVFKWLREEVKMTTPKRKKAGGSLISKSCFYRFLSRSEIAGFVDYKGDKIKLNSCITPMITEDEYWEIQKRLGKKGNRKIKRVVTVYSNLLYSPKGHICTPELIDRVTCDCKAKFSIKKRTQCKNCGLDISKMIRPIFYSKRYYYNAYLRRNKIKAKGISENVLDRHVLDIANSIVLDLGLTKWVRNFIEELADQELKNWQSIQKTKEDRRRKLESRRRRVKEAFLDGTFTKEEYKEETTRIDSEIVSLDKTVSKKDDWKFFLLSLVDLGSEIKGIWKIGGVSDKRAVLTKLGLKFVWDEETLSIYAPIWLETLLKGLCAIKEKNESTKLKNPLVKQEDFGENRELCSTLCRMWVYNQTEFLQKNDTNDLELVKIIIP